MMGEEWATACSAWRIQGALDAIDQALEQVLIARTEREQRWQVNQVNLAVSPVHRDAGPILCLDRSRPPVLSTRVRRSMEGRDRPLPGRRCTDTSSGDASLD
jgi:hypothetical protein